MIKKNLKIFVLLFLVVALAAGVTLVQRMQETRRGAAGTGLPINFSSPKTDYEIGETITAYVDISQPNGKVISNFLLKINYDSSRLLLKTTSGNNAKATDNIILDDYNTDTPGEIFTYGGVDVFSTEGSVRIIKLEFEAKQTGVANVTLNGAASEVKICVPTSEGWCQAGSEGTITDFGVQGGVYNLRDEGGSRPEITISLSPDDGEKKINESFQVVLSANTGVNKITGFEAIFSFKQNQIEVVDIDFPTGTDTPFSSFSDRLIVDSQGQAVLDEQGRAMIEILATTNRSDNLKSGNLSLGTFTLKGKAITSATVSLDSINFSGIASNGEGLSDELIIPSSLQGVYSIVEDPSLPTATPTVTTTPIPTPTGGLPRDCTVLGLGGSCQLLDTACDPGYSAYPGDAACDSAGGHCCIDDVSDVPQLTFKVKFDGVDSKIPDQRVTLIVKKRGISKKQTEVVVASDNKGLLTGKVALVGVKPGPGYYFIIKGPKHIAERFCLEDQDVYCPAEQTLTLGMNNNFDFSGWALRPGDITGEGGLQDGKVDTLDWTFLVKALISDDENIRERANLNFNVLADGSQVIAGDDLRLFVNTLGTKYDDDY